MVYANFTINPTTFPPARVADIGTLLNVILPLLMGGAALLFLLMFLMGALQWLTAGGNMENAKKAQKTLMAAVGGMAIVVVSYFAVKLIGYLLNVSLPL